jgi:hypothetical protein
MVHPIALGDGPEAFTGLEPFDGFGLLMVVELGFAAELGAALDCGDAALVGTAQDAYALLLGQAGQQGEDAAA